MWTPNRNHSLFPLLVFSSRKAFLTPHVEGHALLWACSQLWILYGFTLCLSCHQTVDASSKENCPIHPCNFHVSFSLSYMAGTQLRFAWLCFHGFAYMKLFFISTLTILGTCSIWDPPPGTGTTKINEMEPWVLRSYNSEGDIDGTQVNTNQNSKVDMRREGFTEDVTYELGLDGWLECCQTTNEAEMCSDTDFNEHCKIFLFYCRRTTVTF